MVTKVQETVETVVEQERAFDIAPVRPLGGRGPRGGGGGPNDGGGGGGGGNDRDSDNERDWSPDRFRIGVYVGIASILIMFGALGLAFIVRMQAPALPQSRSVELPPMLWLSTLLILSSSLTFITAKYHLRKGAPPLYWSWLAVTLLLGFGFLISQIVSWNHFSERGFFFASNPHSVFFYVLTALHALHLLGGLAALALLMLYARRSAAYKAGLPRTLAYTDAAGIYWHFMDALWIAVFALLIFGS